MHLTLLQKKAKAAEASKKLDTIIPEIKAAAKDVAAKPTEKKALERLDKAKQAAEDVRDFFACSCE